MKTRHVIGITGGIGSGKSTVSRFWAARAGLPLIDIDQLCRELLEIGMPGWVALKTRLGEAYFDPDGRLNRQCLRAAIFDDAGLRHVVNQFIHPLAMQLLHKKMGYLDGDVLVDVPLLFEAGWEKQFSRTVVVYADRQTCCRRLCSRDRILPGEAVKAIAVQMSIGEKALRADHVVDNRYCWLLTRMQISHLAEIVRTGCPAESSGASGSDPVFSSVQE
jgi:dephospho-CoA kinase